MFGSVWQGGAKDFSAVIHNVSNPQVFSDTMAVDWFAHNDDRHLGNYLYLDLAGDIVVRVIDFSRAMLYQGWPMPSLPLPAACNTMSGFRAWSVHHSYQKPLSLLQVMAAMPSDWMSNILDEMPPQWLDQQMRDNLMNWWAGPQRQQRINEAELHLP